MNFNCPKCDHNYESEDKFCGGCGHKLHDVDNFVAKTQVEMKLSDIRLNLGIIYLKKGDHVQASEVFKKVLQDEPENIEAQELLKQAEQASAQVSNTSAN